MYFRSPVLADTPGLAGAVAAGAPGRGADGVPLHPLLGLLPLRLLLVLQRGPLRPAAHQNRAGLALFRRLWPAHGLHRLPPAPHVQVPLRGISVTIEINSAMDFLVGKWRRIIKRRHSVKKNISIFLISC